MDLELACLVWVYSWHPEADEDEDQDEAEMVLGAGWCGAHVSHIFAHSLVLADAFNMFKPS